MAAIGVEKAHVSGLLGGAIRQARQQHRERVKTVAAFLLAEERPVSEGDRRQTIAKGLGNVQEMAVQGILPFCLTPELYAAKPDYVDQLAAFVRSRPK